MAEPMPGRTTAPFISEAVQRIYDRLPRIYRVLDEQNAWALKRYMGGVLAFAGELDDELDAIRGSRPVGPATPAPWDLPADEFDRWLDARRDVNSTLTDPDLAPAERLPYIAQLLGVYLGPQSSEAERRDTIRFATSGYRGGTREAIANAAKAALTGSRFADVQPMARSDGGAATIWDVTVRTRSTETPSSQAVLDAILRQGAKPAGVRLWHTTYGSSWDVIEARFPTWADWDASTWDRIEEAGVTYAVPDNMAPGPSMESTTDTGKWTPLAYGGGSVPTFALAAGAGIDGVNAGRLTKVNATGGMRVQSAVVTDAKITPGRQFILGASFKPSVAVPVTLQVNWQTAAGAAISSTTLAAGTATAGQWNRLTTTHTSPANAARATLEIIATGTVPAGATVDVDAVLFRLVSSTTG